jgi:KaiC/GvpD/RAD55 family RecA-like ATPase
VLPEKTKFNLYSVADVLDFPDPQWEIEDVFAAGTFVMVFGESGAHKSFLVIDWGLTLAVGIPWMGKAVCRRRVLLIAAEGGRGYNKRLAAWMDERGVPEDALEDFRMLVVGVQLVDEREEFLRAVREFAPDVIIMDPFADCAAGIDENVAAEMNEFIHAVRAVQRQLGATFVLVHHTGWDPKRERGSSRLRQAADVVISVSARDSIVTVENVKQRDADKFDPIQLRPHSVTATRNGREYRSLVLLELDATDSPRRTLGSDALRLLRILGDQRTGIATPKEWRALAAHGRPLKERTFYNRLKELLGLGAIGQLGKGQYQLTTVGRQLIQAATANDLQ